MSGLPIAAAALGELAERCVACTVELNPSNRHADPFFCVSCAILLSTEGTTHPAALFTRHQALLLLNSVEHDVQDLDADLVRLDLPADDRTHLTERRHQLVEVLDLLCPNWRDPVRDEDLDLATVELRRAR